MGESVRTPLELAFDHFITTEVMSQADHIEPPDIRLLRSAFNRGFELGEQKGRGEAFSAMKPD